MRRRDDMIRIIISVLNLQRLDVFALWGRFNYLFYLQYFVRNERTKKKKSIHEVLCHLHTAAGFKMSHWVSRVIETENGQWLSFGRMNDHSRR